MKKLPVSGAEDVYTDLKFGTKRGILNNNCYAWALGNYKGSGGYKLQPGNLAGESNDMDASSCSFLRQRVLDDNRARGIMVVDPTKKCPLGYYKIMAFIDQGNDYHWYKQHKDLLYRVTNGETLATISKDLGVPLKNVVSPRPVPRPNDLVYVKDAKTFSHKQGFATGPLLRDASRKTIPDPRKANRNYGDFNYKTFCGAYCVKNVTKGAVKGSGALLQKRGRKVGTKAKQPLKLGTRRRKV
jgi:hypothetical protein